jgi:flagellar motor switch protein FliN/FliY
MIRQHHRVLWNVGVRRMASNVDNVKVEISVVLGRSVIPMHQLLRMGRGAVIELDTNQDDPVTILANDKPVAKGEIEIQGEKIAVSVVELLQSYE